MNFTLTGKRIIPAFLALAGFFLLFTPASHAQAQDNIATLSDPGTVAMEPSADDSQDPPTRVARISYLDGTVSMQPGGTGEWGTAAKNRPVTIGDKIWADKDSRIELQAGQAAIHVGSMTALSFLNLNENIIQMRLAEGHVNLRVRELREGETYEVDTPNLAFTVREAGAFRIDVSENGDYSTVTVIRGKGEVSAAGQEYPVNLGERADVSGTDANVKYLAGTASEPDALDRWAQERNLKEDGSASARYVSRDTVGYSDLDDYGSWKDEPEYGHVWVPRDVAPDWSPYSDGNWSYVAPWGWTWVGYEPWGFAPYHYGRWNNFGSYWGWCPGPIYARPYYGPAFVGFLGGFSVGVGFGFGGGYGWFPLGWGEPYRPWYHCGGNYWRNVNIYNTRINNFNYNSRGFRGYNYRYANNNHAVNFASHNAFVNGERIHGGSARLSPSALRGAHVVNGVSARPTSASYFGGAGRHGNVAAPSANVQNRGVVARTAPAAAASHMPVRTLNSSPSFNNRNGSSPRGNGNRNISSMPAINSSRQSQLSANRPPSANQQGGRNLNSINGNSNSARPNGNFNNNSRPTSTPRAWNAQGNSTDSGRAPQGFGGNQRNGSAQNTRMNSTNRPPWAGSRTSTGNSGNYTSPQYQGRNNSVNRPATNYNGGNRSYTPPSSGNRSPSNYNAAPNRNYSSPRSYSAPSNRNYSAPRSYNAPSNRSYSAPRSYSSGPSNSAPRSYSAPRSSGGGGGGGGYHGGGGGGGSAPHGGGGAGAGASHGGHH